VSVSDNPATNREIDQVLARHSPDEQTKTLDALESIKYAGADGLSVNAWADHLKSLYPDLQVGPLLASIVKEFPFCIKRLAPKRYGWVESDPDAEEPVDSALRYAMQSQVGLTMTRSLRCAKWASSVPRSLSLVSRRNPAHRASRRRRFPIIFSRNSWDQSRRSVPTAIA
jgi:hypothetical protein